MSYHEGGKHSYEASKNNAQGGIKGPRATRTAAFRDLQKLWYDKARASGFRDVEGWRDTNKLTTSTLPGDRFVFVNDHSRTMLGNEKSQVERSLEMNAQIFGAEVSTSDLPEAKAWRDLSKAANDLPDGYKHRAFLIDVCQVGCIAPYLLRRHKLTRGWARGTWRRFLEVAEMPEATRLLVKGHVREPEGG